MPSLIDLLQSGQLGGLGDLPEALTRLLQQAQPPPIQQPGPAAVPVPGISVSPPMGMAPPPAPVPAGPVDVSGAPPAPGPAPAAAPQAAQPVAKPPVGDLPPQTWRQTLRNVGNALQGKDTPDRDAQNETFKALVGKGVSPDIAQAAVSNPTVMAQIAPIAFGGGMTTIKPGEVALGKGPDGKPGIVFDNRESQKPYDFAPGHVGYDPITKKPIYGGGLAPTDRADILKTTTELDTIRAAQVAMKEARMHSDKAFDGGLLSGPDTWMIQNLPAGLTSQEQRDAANATTQLTNLSQNAALQAAKTQAGGRVTVYIDKAMQALAPNSAEPKGTRNEKIDRAIQALDEREAELRQRIDGIKSGAMYQPGSTPGAESAASKAPRIRTYNPATGRLE